MICPTCGHENIASATVCAACATPLPANIQTGHTEEGTPNAAAYTPLLEKGVRLQGSGYAVGEVLGQGGFGITYKGGDLSLRRYVAIKEFFPYGCVRQGNNVVPSGGLSAAEYDSIKAKFLEEARTLARFSHPGIVRVFGAFEENNTAYMVMEFLEGQTLSKRMNEQGALDAREVVTLAQSIGKALEAVHGAGLLHRDIKPDNVCLTPDGRVVLIDFGTARAFAAGKTVQQTRQLTPGYAPLEQYSQQARFGPYTDIYAFGATLYHALTGQMPPPATDRAAGVELKDPRTLNPRLSSTVSQALVWALQVKATERPQSVSQFLQALVAPTPEPTPAPTNTPINTTSAPQAAPATSGWGVPSGATPAPDAHPAQEWFHNAGGKESGPVAREVLKNLIHHGIVRAETLVWRQGMPDWGPAAQTEWAAELATVLPRSISPGGDGFPPLNATPETGFDRFMSSIPSWGWYTLWLTVFLLGVGRMGVAVVRYQNGDRDFGTQLASRVLDDSKAVPLSEATLELGDPVYDETALVNRHDNYTGRVRYKDGDAGTLALEVTKRDWLYAPEKFDFTFAPTDFGSVMEGPIETELVAKLGASRVDVVKLGRETRTAYSGYFATRNPDTRQLTRGGSVYVTVKSFDRSGAPASWSYRITD